MGAEVSQASGQLVYAVAFRAQPLVGPSALRLERLALAPGGGAALRIRPE